MRAGDTAGMRCWPFDQCRWELRMDKVRSSAAVVLVAAVLLLAGACSSSGSDKAKTDSGGKTPVASDTGKADTGSSDTGSSDTGTSSDTGGTTGGGTSPGHANDAAGLKAAAEDFS